MKYLLMLWAAFLEVDWPTVKSPSPLLLPPRLVCAVLTPVVTNDQALLAVMSCEARGGGIIQLLEGDYRIVFDMVAPNVLVRGLGADKTRVNLSSQEPTP